MFNTGLDYRKLVRMILSILAALLVLAASHRALRASPSHSFILSAPILTASKIARAKRPDTTKWSLRPAARRMAIVAIDAQ